MFTNNRIILVAAFVIGSTFFVLTNCRDKDGVFTGKAGLSPSSKNVDSPVPPADFPAPSDNRATRPAAKPEDQAEAQKQNGQLRALAAMADLLAKSVKPDFTLEKMVTKLVEFGVEPEIARDSNAETGDMFTVRSKNPFKGTRYFHAQYFGGAGVTPILQHMSFEFRPGPKAMQEAVTAVEQAFGLQDPPVEANAKFKKYRVGEDYIVWIKKMDAEDLEENPLNVYTPSDAGTIQIAVELEIHESEGDSAEEHF